MASLVIYHGLPVFKYLSFTRPRPLGSGINPDFGPTAEARSDFWVRYPGAFRPSSTYNRQTVSPSGGCRGLKVAEGVLSKSVRDSLIAAGIRSALLSVFPPAARSGYCHKAEWLLPSWFWAVRARFGVFPSYRLCQLITFLYPAFLFKLFKPLGD